MEKMEMQMLHASHALTYQFIMIKVMMVVVGFDGMTWQDLVDFHTKICGKRKDVDIKIVIIQQFFISSTWNRLNQELTGMNNKLGTTIGLVQ